MLVGVDIGGTKTAVVIGRASPHGLKITARRAFPTVSGVRPWRKTVKEISGAARALLEQTVPQPVQIEPLRRCVAMPCL